MRIIKVIMAFELLLVTFIGNAQIKVHDDNHISIGSLNKDFGVQINPSGYTYFASRVNSDYTWITLAQARNHTTKCWIVNRNDMTFKHRFFVDGFGFVYRFGEATLSDASMQSFLGVIDNANNVISQMNGFYYTYIDDVDNYSKGQDGNRCVGFSAQEIEDILPEAVLKDEEGKLYLNYEVITVFLVEAVKEQQHEIQELRKILEDHGLMK